MAQITNYALDVSIKADTVRITGTVNDDKTTLYDGVTDELAAEQKEALVSLFTMNDHDEAEQAGKAEAENQLPREATFHAKFSAPAGVPLDVPGFIKAVLEYCGDDDENDDTNKDKDESAARGAPDMSGMPQRGGMPGMWGRGGMRGRGGFRGMWGGRGGMAGMMGHGGMGPGGVGCGGMGPGGMGPGVSQATPCIKVCLARMARTKARLVRMDPTWQFQGKSRHGAIALTIDIREI
ncbi:hypothetical protein AMAG_10464 [Allomyces macrogynus ATCC 38327]|uniref:Uncharacterized protein n=1 Tax=Allomyces macrogynus (strain ATCC 38327) TaxID=578462 RepID=A0A0L0SUT4_ALLM3|nr:hypothetical protein AMAG_10464 [Allomyces macrogynus ATCC 38327]|eukprot:KNE66226.1 hypothetical protein AMAG_10464 [Allomyces macrogynus ATCC 38327]